MKKIFQFLFVFGCTFFSACSRNGNTNSTACTMEFRTVNIQVTGAVLDSFYTIRQATGDTIKLNAINNLNEFSYPILDDSYVTNLMNRTETFVFYGFINHTMVVQENFQIKSDMCHIEYVSGRLEVQL